MNTFIFELIGITPDNLGAVLAALKNVAGCACTAIQTSRGNYILTVTTDLSEDEALDAVNAALNPLGVQAKKTVPLKPVYVGTKPKM